MNNLSIVLLLLFVRKFEKILRFYVNYCALNKFTRKNRYLLLLNYETLNNITKIKCLRN